jgi:endonuclease G
MSVSYAEKPLKPFSPPERTSVRAQFVRVVEKSTQERQRVRTLISQGRWRDAEPDRTRFRRFADRKAAKIAPRHGAESLIGPTIDLQGTSFLTEGSAIRRAIAYVEVNDLRSSEVASGFLISPRLFLTNCHVIRDANAAQGAQITFDREMDELGRPRPTTTFLLDPAAFALFSDVDTLDYALIAVGRRNAGSAAIDDFGYCILSDTPDRHVIGMNVNIVEHPRGWPKMIAVRNNPLTYRTDRTLLYETDTDEGSSGSAVFNDEWDLVALHHWGQPYLEKRDDQGQDIPVNVQRRTQCCETVANRQ